MSRARDGRRNAKKHRHAKTLPVLPSPVQQIQHWRGWARCRDASVVWATVMCVGLMSGDSQPSAALACAEPENVAASPYAPGGSLMPATVVMNDSLSDSSAASESQSAAADDPAPAAKDQPAANVSPEPHPSAPSEPLHTTVTMMNDNTEEIRLIKDKSAIVRTNAPISRAGVSNPDIADVQQVTNAREIVITGRSFGATQLVLWTNAGEQKMFNVIVEVDLPMLNDAIRRMSPLARVDTRMLSGTLVLTGRVPDALTAERIEALAKIVHARVVNQMSVGGIQQTVLRCTVAEVNKQATRDLSMNWAIGGGDWTKDFFFANNLGQLNPSTFGNNANANLLASPPIGRHNNKITRTTYFEGATQNGAGSNITFGFPRAEFQVFMQALRENSLLRVLAEPNVVAVNGQEASFLSGGEFPIAVAQSGSFAGAISIEYKQFGILLKFTPTILGNGQVRMKLVAEVSDLVPSSAGTAGGLPVFSLTTRRVESTVEVGHEQTIAIGGLLSERIQALSSKIPGLGDVPVLGSLFSSTQYQRNETELVVLVTPELVEPMDVNQVPPVPGHQMTAPSDFDLYLNGKLEGKPGQSQKFDTARRPEMTVDAAARANDSRTMELSVQGPWGTSDFEER